MILKKLANKGMSGMASSLPLVFVGDHFLQPGWYLHRDLGPSNPFLVHVLLGGGSCLEVGGCEASSVASWLTTPFTM